ncbi:glutamate racemase [Bacteroidia bacterium]|nr:glutamate racemase [Bacteroidia bacterium]
MNTTALDINGEPLGAAQPIGIFDSGVGGMSVMRELVRLLPNEDVIYFADSAHCPYGTQSAEAVQQRSQQIVSFLAQEQHCKLIVVACNTATAAAIAALRAQHPALPFVGMEPAVKPATQQSQQKRIGLLATQATLQGSLLQHTMQQYAQGVEVQMVAGNGLVELVEQGNEDSPAALHLLRRLLQPMLSNGIDTLVLGCTHYPFLQNALQQITANHITIIDPAPAVALQAKRLLAQRELTNEAKNAPRYVFFTSGEIKCLQLMQQRHLPLENVTYSKSTI